MTFLQPFILYGLPLLLLPIIIHLVNRMRHRTVPWAAMRFLLKATQSSTSHAKLRQFLILALRVLAVIALILFLGRPLAGGWLGWALALARRKFGSPRICKKPIGCRKMAVGNQCWTSSKRYRRKSAFV